ncbi:MAG: LysR family transcriptional regulator [Halioglobus sp.]
MELIISLYGIIDGRFFYQLQVYVAVAEEEGFAAAARRLQPAPAVTRAVAALEDTLGVKLLDCTTCHVRVTEAGRRYRRRQAILAG